MEKCSELSELARILRRKTQILDKRWCSKVWLTLQPKHFTQVNGGTSDQIIGFAHIFAATDIYLERNIHYQN